MQNLGHEFLTSTPQLRSLATVYMQNTLFVTQTICIVVCALSFEIGATILALRDLLYLEPGI
ncbi:hypothetical protein BPOR_0537g00070 [Botrytis porri]|uniref:Uncharacterized protein n=1 Tax=Botrytis porri TaxID=87229 RepID=A0A4Z1KIW6_9HELO|nr:hypothetical protein BPOR_0537g00070 [Botrytis porri]